MQQDAKRGLEQDAPLSREERLRRVVIICINFMRNLAYLRGAYESPEGWQSQAGELVVPDASFWRTVSNNLLDMCVLEFCKLFADKGGKHFWKKIVTDQDRFFAELLAQLGMTEQQYADYLNALRTYRDKFVAHLDEHRTMYTPKLDAAGVSVQHLHAWLVANECPPGLLNPEHSAPERLIAAFKGEQSVARRIFSYVREIGRGSSETGGR
uniref:AbiU2 domain-containing protein n=1 Tax=Bradyrhizobium sp. (strain ORS 278) TaxID=114615 RepID=UPI0012FEC0AB|nr:hypothetical protein [Bradyrhizobium sp. ORS 278]